MKKKPYPVALEAHVSLEAGEAVFSLAERRKEVRRCGGGCGKKDRGWIQQYVC